MELIICGIISLTLLAATVVVAILLRKDLRKSVRALSAGFFVTIFVALAPCHIEQNSYSFGVNLFNTICVMITQSSLTDSLEAIARFQSSLTEAYRVYLIVLYVLGPVSIASATLSFVKGFGKLVYAVKSTFAESYIFSSLNKRSLAVCRSVRAQHPKAVLLFALDGGTDGADESALSQVEEMGAIVVRQNIKDVRHGLNRKRHYCLLEDGADNIEHGLALNSKFKNNKTARSNVELLIYSTGEMSQIIFYNTPHYVTIHLFREEDIIANDLLFNHPLYGGIADGKLNILLVGVGKIGYAILKKMIWCGYLGKKVKTQINVLDVNAKAVESRLKKECPALLRDNDINVKFHNANINDNGFAEALDKLDAPTYIVVSLGDEQLNVETCIYLRRHFGIEKGLPKLYMTANSEDYINKLRLVSVYDWNVGDDRSFCKRDGTEQDFEIYGFGSYERAYRLINPSESPFGKLALACHVCKMNLSLNGKGGYRYPDETIEQFVGSATYSYNQIFFNKNNADQLALSIDYLLYALDYPKKCDDYLEQIRVRLNLSSIYDIPFALYVSPDYNLEGELQANIDELLEIVTERYNRFMYTLGWTNLPIDEIKNKSTRDQLRLRYARIGDYDVEALEKLINDGASEQKNYRENDKSEILRLPKILEIFDELEQGV